MISIPTKHAPILLESLEESLYKIALEMEKFKGSPLTAERKVIEKRQKALEELQHLVSIQMP
jgi:hypothetical protein